MKSFELDGFPTANEMGGRAIGAIFFSVFGAIWVSLSLFAREQLIAITGLAVGGVLLTLLAVCLWLLRVARRFPRVADDPMMAKTFNRVNGVQWAAGAIVAFTLNRLHLDAYTVPAIGVIVGLHMFPLARLFRYSPHYVTGAMLVLWSGGTTLLVPVEQLQGVCALGTGMILWSSAATTLMLALAKASRTTLKEESRSLHDGSRAEI